MGNRDKNSAVAYAKDFANAVQQRHEFKYYKLRLLLSSCFSIFRQQPGHLHRVDQPEDANGDQLLHRQPGSCRRRHRPLLHPIPVSGKFHLGVNLALGDNPRNKLGLKLQSYKKILLLSAIKSSFWEKNAQAGGEPRIVLTFREFSLTSSAL